MSRIAGTAYVKVDGAQYTLAGTLTVSTDSFTREGLAGLSGVAGYKEMPRVPFIEGEFYTTPDVSLPALEAVTNATVTAELANGKTYVLRNAWSAGAREVNAAEGTFTLRFEGMEGIEQS
jgi:hypothetical protein